MPDFRNEVRSALEDEWGPGASAPGLGERLVAAGERSHRPALLPVMAAAVVGVLFVAAGGAALLANISQPGRTMAVPARTSPAATPVPSPYATALPAPQLDFGTPPAGVPYFYYVDPRQPGWLVAVDWTGARRGTIKAAPPSDGGAPNGVSSPDGSRVLLVDTLYDLSAQAQPAWPNDKTASRWADDNRHLCGTVTKGELVGSTVPEILQTLLPGQPPRSLATLGAASAETGTDVVACSYRNGRALDLQRGPSGVPRESWLVSLATGAVLHHQVYAYSSTGATNVVASSDARYIAENDQPFAAASRAPRPTVVRDSATGGVVATLPAGLWAVAFSGDGVYAVVEGNAENDVRVINWRTGRKVWSLAPSDIPDPSDVFGAYSVAVSPSGPGIAIGFSHRAIPLCPAGSASPCANNVVDQLEDVVLIRPDLTTVTVATRVALLVPNT